MVNLVSFLALLFSFNASAAIVPSGVPSIQLGGIGSQLANSQATPGSVLVSGSDTAEFTLYAGTLSLGGGGTVYPFKKNGVIYQVTAGKTARCSVVSHRVSSASGGWQLMSGTATFADATASGSVTGGVWQCGAAAVYCKAGHVTGNTTTVEGMQYVFGASTWPGFQGADNTQLYQISLVCHESP